MQKTEEKSDAPRILTPEEIARLKAQADMLEHKLRMTIYFTQSNADDTVEVATAISKYATSQS